ncbi:MAG: hypothetical protein KDC44_18460, partial [Phaeodactylibacter sp.]|nr:hypothetical protein [Phaeodactylibacter sp.]
LAAVERLEDAERALAEAEEARFKAQAQIRNQADSPILQDITFLPSGDPGAVQSATDQSTAIQIDGVNRVAEITKERIEETSDLKQQKDKEDAEAAIDNEQSFWSRAQSLAVSALAAISDAVFNVQEQRLEDELATNLEGLEAEYAQRQELAEGNTVLQTQLDEELATKKKALEAQAATDRKKIAIKEGIAQLALGVIEAIPDPFRIASAFALGAIQLAVIRSQQFARGGKVLSVDPTPLSSGLITAAPNIATQPNGDSVLATVKPGEVILNELQQKLLGGAATFKSIGVPGFADGGRIPQVINPNAFFGNNSLGDLVARFDEDQVNQLASLIGKQAKAGSKEGIAEGLDDANRTA